MTDPDAQYYRRILMKFVVQVLPTVDLESVPWLLTLNIFEVKLFDQSSHLFALK
jgi:hypothetical protein